MECLQLFAHSLTACSCPANSCKLWYVIAGGGACAVSGWPLVMVWIGAPVISDLFNWNYQIVGGCYQLHSNTEMSPVCYEWRMYPSIASCHSYGIRKEWYWNLLSQEFGSLSDINQCHILSVSLYFRATITVLLVLHVNCPFKNVWENCCSVEIARRKWNSA